MFERILFSLGFVKGIETNRTTICMIDFGMGKLVEVTYLLPSGQSVTKKQTV